MKISRRDFVFSVAALSFAPPQRLLASLEGVSARSNGSELGLTNDEKGLLDAFCERIIPADEYPGASELGVVEFIDRTLKEAHPDWIVLYRTGLKSSELSCQQVHGSSFVRLDPGQQNEFLRRMERGDLPPDHWYGYSSGDFFGMVRDHTMQGYYSHPKYGGNREKLAWKMIGYEDWWVIE